MTTVSRILVDAWYRREPWLWLLRPLEWIYRPVVWLRRWLYRRGILATFQPGRPCVVVGNITAGGTGKTPVVIALVEALGERGIPVGVVSRGYGARHGAIAQVVGEHSTAAECGDEPLLIHRRTGAPCAVSSSRVTAARTLLARYPVKLVISDDGLQHYALGRSLEIAMLDGALDVGNGFCLPAGPLREPRSRLDSVDFVLVRGPQAGGNGVTYHPDGLVNLVNNRCLPPDPNELGTQVYAVAGIGRPDQFADTLRGLGFEPELVRFRDHHDYRPADLAGLAGKPVIMTEKDAVKCASFATTNHWFLRIHAQLPDPVIDAVVALAEI
jgi:tetraacyldisaccharide 4'-kinase